MSDPTVTRSLLSLIVPSPEVPAITPSPEVSDPERPEVLVVCIDDVEKHPDADRLEILHIGGFRCVVNLNEDGSSRYRVDDFVVYIPEGSVLTEPYMHKFGWWDQEKDRGLLAGGARNRVKAMKIRGVLSQGIVHALVSQDSGSIENEAGETIQVQEGEDVAAFLKIVKWDPLADVVDEQGRRLKNKMAGNLMPLPTEKGLPLRYEIENIKKGHSFEPDMLVDVTEKLHGTLIQVGFDPTWRKKWKAVEAPDWENGEPVDMVEDLSCVGFGGTGKVYVTSKGIAKSGLVFKNDAVNEGNLYVRAASDKGMVNFVEQLASMWGMKKAVVVFGEVIGVQDLKYGLQPGDHEVRVFDIWVEDLGWLPAEMMRALCVHNFVGFVPCLTMREWSELQNSYEDMTGGNSIASILMAPQIREGIVLKPASNKGVDRRGRRMIYKSISEQYLLRKGGTEFN